MSSKIRIILLIIFVALFFLIVPVILLYANGYRFNFKYHRLTKTGNLLADSLPNNAFVILDNKMIEPDWYNKFSSYYKKTFGLINKRGTTPSLIDNLLPGTYNIKIIKDGYYPWQKKIEIQPNITTSLKNVQLFLEKPSLKTLEEGIISNESISPSQNKMIYKICQNKVCYIKLFDKTTEKISLLETLNNFKNITKINWSPDETKILFLDQYHRYFIFDLLSQKLTNLNQKITDISYKNKIKWQTNSTIFVSKNRNIYSYNIFNFNSQLFFSKDNGEIKDWFITKNYIDILIYYKKELFLERYKLKNNQLITYTELPNLSFEFLPIKNNEKIRFLKTKNKIMICEYETNQKEINSTSVYAKEIFLFKKPNEYFFYNNYELWLLNIDQTLDNNRYKFQKEIINRLSKTIVSAKIYDFQNYFIYANHNKIWAMSFDGINPNNITKIFDANEIKIFLLSPKKIYFVGEIDNQKGLFALTIQ